MQQTEEHSIESTEVAQVFESDEARFHSFRVAVDAIRERVEAEVGSDDVRHIFRLNRFSRSMEVMGRGVIHFSPEPLSFSLGVVLLWVHKQLQMIEIGHTVLHGTYDKLDGAKKFDSKSFWWEMPIDEESWRNGHNIRHHMYTNIAHKDSDMNFGTVRLTEQTPHRFIHYIQSLVTFLIAWPFFGLTMNLHFTGMLDVYGLHGWAGKFDVIRQKNLAEIRGAHQRFFRKVIPYFLKEYAFFPLLAGPMFWKVVLGNWLSERMRDFYSAAAVYCGHIGKEVSSYPVGTRAGCRGKWYAMQVESANNFTVPRPFDFLCGGVEHQIEHHMFPSLPPQRLREISPAIEAACLQHGIRYRRASWAHTIWEVIKQIVRLSRKGGPGIRNGR